MAGTQIDSKRYMKLYVYLPVALRPETRDALLISFGVGSTSKALADTAGLSRIDIIDISRDILDLSNVVYPGADNPLRDERVHVHIEDGRFFLNSTSRRYDLITSEPPPPKLAGVVNLYSEEYYRLIRDHLNPGGYATYWLPVHQLTPADTLAIIKGFCNAFDNCSLWSGGGLEWMLMGSNGAGARVSADAFAAQWRDERVAPELAALGLELPAQMGSLFMADAAQLAAFTEGVPPVTDNYPLRLSSTIPNRNERAPLYDRVMDEDERLERFRASEYVRAIWPTELVEHSPPFFRYEHLIKSKLTANIYSDADEPFRGRRSRRSPRSPRRCLVTGSDRVTFAVATRRGDGPRLELASRPARRRDFAAALDTATLRPPREDRARDLVSSSICSPRAITCPRRTR
jgi:hypothetical protein